MYQLSCRVNLPGAALFCYNTFLLLSLLCICRNRPNRVRTWKFVFHTVWIHTFNSLSPFFHSAPFGLCVDKLSPFSMLVAIFFLVLCVASLNLVYFCFHCDITFIVSIIICFSALTLVHPSFLASDSFGCVVIISAFAVVVYAFLYLFGHIFIPNRLAYFNFFLFRFSYSLVHLWCIVFVLLLTPISLLLLYLLRNLLQWFFVSAPTHHNEFALLLSSHRTRSPIIYFHYWFFLLRLHCSQLWIFPGV